MEGTGYTLAQVGDKFLWTSLMYMQANTKSKAHEWRQVTTDRLN
jgi:hypothetical protein